MDFLGARVKLNPRPVRQIAAAMEVVFLGHCPGAVRVERLLALQDAVAEIRALGLSARLEKLQPAASDLYHLPVPLRSLAEFDDTFPDARTAPTQYRSRLAGATAWLPQVVEDFFANGGEKCWVIQIPENEGVNGFLPSFDTPLYDTDNLQGLATALILNQAALVALPDLERLQVPANLPDIPRQRLANPDPQFLPCGTQVDDGHRERRYSEEIPPGQTPQACIHVLRRMLNLINQHRPDLQCLFTLPLDYSESQDSPAIDPAALADIDQARRQSYAHILRQVQFLFPYIRSSRHSLQSPAGLVAGLIAAGARNQGVWRSVAGLPMQTDGRPYPALATTDTIKLRESPGIGLLRQRRGRTHLDDERLSVPALHRDDYRADLDSEYLNGLRAAEVVRFIGFLLRQLQSLGERLIFNVDYNDPRPRLMLEKFLNNLFHAGALRGSLPEQAYSIRRASAREATIAYDIEIAPAFPVDKIVLTFINRNGAWFSRVGNA